MNATSVSTFKKLYKDLRDYEKKVNKQVDSLRHMQAAYMSLAKTCDHKRSSGKSAIKTVKCCDQCNRKVRVCQVCFRVIERNEPTVATALPGVAAALDSLPEPFKSMFKNASLVEVKKFPPGPPLGPGGNPSRN